MLILILHLPMLLSMILEINYFMNYINFLNYILYLYILKLYKYFFNYNYICYNYITFFKLQLYK